MPVIAFAIGKGGAGKTTTSLIVAGELANLGATVTVIDADPNKALVEWSRKPGVPENLDVVGDVTEETIIDVIEEASSRSSFVIVDLEGIQSTAVSYAVSMANLVIIPMQGSQLDAPKAASMIRLIKQQERVARRAIPYAIVLTRTSPAIVPGTLRHIQQSLAERDVPVLRTQVFEREAYKAMFSFGGTLSSLKDKRVSNVDTAQRNAHALAVEIVDRLKGEAPAELAVVA
jgi:chromosome partitioning protein